MIRFFAPDYERMEVFAHIGGQPLGMAFDRNDNLYICIGGMGLYRIAPDGKVEKATDETNRSLRSVNDDSRLRLADDLDITDNGLIFFSEATIRYEMDEWPVDGLEARGNGRIICYDTNTGRTHTAVRGLKFPNGICVASDGQSILFAETFGCSIKRYWFEGPKKGAIEVVMDNLPGYPDNINLASDGNYWLALVGMRSPSLDLAWRMPGFRTRMAKRVPIDEWLFPNINTGCVVKFNEKGEILDSLWDLKGVNHPMITSMREHRGYLYLGGIANNRIGRYKLEGRRPEVRPVREAMGAASVIAAIKEFANRILGRGDATITVPSFDGALKPNQKLEQAETIFECVAPEDLATDGANLYLADGPRLLRLDGNAATEIRAFDRRSPRSHACAAAASQLRSADARYGSIADPSAPRAADGLCERTQRRQRACGRSRRHADRDRRLANARRRSMGDRPPGARPERTGPCPRPGDWIGEDDRKRSALCLRGVCGARRDAGQRELAASGPFRRARRIDEGRSSPSARLSVAAFAGRRPADSG